MNVCLTGELLSQFLQFFVLTVKSRSQLAASFLQNLVILLQFLDLTENLLESLHLQLQVQNFLRDRFRPLRNQRCELILRFVDRLLTEQLLGLYLHKVFGCDLVEVDTGYLLQDVNFVCSCLVLLCQPLDGSLHHIKSVRHVRGHLAHLLHV